MLKELRRRYVQTGTVRYVFANHPLPIHQNARLLARSAICAGRQDQYWALHDRLFENEPKTMADVTRLTDDLTLKRDAFDACMEDETAATTVIDADIKVATGLGLMSTPSFAVGTVLGDGRIRLHRLIVGAQPFSVFQSTLDNLAAGRLNRGSLLDWFRRPS